MRPTIFSAINAGMCNQFLSHYVTKLLCLDHGFSYRCGIQFVADGFPQLESQCEPTTQNAITINKSAICQKGTLNSYPFQNDKTYILNGMLGAMEDSHFPGIVKRPVPRQFLFQDMKKNITQYQFIFNHQDLLKEFNPCVELAQKSQKYLEPFQGDFLIGVHRRRTDYTSWNQGLYMDTDEQIFEKINYFRSVCGIRRPKFILCTDEPDSVSFLSEERDVFLMNTEKEVEWLILQQMQFLIGAVSTFTFTAAGFRSIPYVFANEVINDDFQKYVQAGLTQS
jgi:hypothetical protein